ncbi:hypothetical protein ACFQZC_38070 [Streptacidiphilus monticola]
MATHIGKISSQAGTRRPQGRTSPTETVAAITSMPMVARLTPVIVPPRMTEPCTPTSRPQTHRTFNSR